MKIKQALILHSIDDVQHCIAHGLQNQYQLFSTHSSVDVYLKEVHSITCVPLSSLVSDGEMKETIAQGYQRVEEILNSMDQEMASQINRLYDLNLRYFFPLYLYYGKIHYIAYQFLFCTITKIIGQYGLRRVVFYRFVPNELLNVTTDIGKIRSAFSPEIIIETIENGKRNTDVGRKYAKYVRVLKRIMKDPSKFDWKKLLDKFSVNRADPLSTTKKTILLFKELYEFQYLPEELQSEFNVLLYQEGNNAPLGFADNDELQVKHLNDFLDTRSAQMQRNTLESIFVQDILEDFRRNVPNYLKTVLLLKKIHASNPISLGVWGNPPVCGAKSLVFEFLRSEGVPVMGGQHGGGYGDTLLQKHFDSDYRRCDYFISYGFTEEDLKRGHPDRKIDAQILSVGRPQRTYVQSNLHRKKVDLLFPMTNCKSFFSGGMVRILPHVLTQRQIRILEYLDSLKDCSVIVKPFINASYDNCSVMPLLTRLRNVQVLNHLSLKDTLKQYEPRAVVIEYPSTPLYDVLELDTEIFLMNAIIGDFENQALEELQRRVHYAEEIDKFIDQVDLFLKGRLEKKRDNMFAEHYLKKGDTRNKVLDLVHRFSRQQTEELKVETLLK